MIAVPTIKTIFKTSSYAEGDKVTIEVIGHQWWWEFRYLELGVVTANEMNVPVGKTVNLRMTSADVLHSFWVPQFAGKRDVFPNRETRIWFTAREAGDYPGACAEFCGLQHGRMAFYVIAREAGEDFWRLPLVDRLSEDLRSEVADCKNIGGGYGGAISAGHFLVPFAADVPFAHCDIAGPATAERAWGVHPKGATGVGVMTLVEYLTRTLPAYA